MRLQLTGLLTKSLFEGGGGENGGAKGDWGDGVAAGLVPKPLLVMFAEGSSHLTLADPLTDSNVGFQSTPSVAAEHAGTGQERVRSKACWGWEVLRRLSA